MKKFIIVLGLVVCCSFLLSGCGQKEPVANSNDNLPANQNAGQPATAVNNNQANSNNGADTSADDGAAGQGMENNKNVSDCDRDIVIYPDAQVKEALCGQAAAYLGFDGVHLLVPGTASNEISKAVGEFYKSEYVGKRGWKIHWWVTGWGAIGTPSVSPGYDESGIAPEILEEINKLKREQQGNKVNVGMSSYVYTDRKKIITIQTLASEENNNQLLINIALEKFVDSDDDGLADSEEGDSGSWKTDPNKPDTDGDGYKDGDEVEAGYDPNGPGKINE